MNYGRPLTETPLKPAVFHILLALSRGPGHGLGIADAVLEQSGGEIRLGPGTLYRALRDMTEAALIEPTGDPLAADPRRKYYRITDSGSALLGVEAKRLARIVDIARDRRVIGEHA